MRYIDLSVLGLEWNEFCVDDTPPSVGNAPAPTACIINGRLCYFYNCGSDTNPVLSIGAKLVMIGDDGTICNFVTPDLKQPFTGYGQIGQRGFADNIDITGNVIRWSFSGGASYEWVIPTDFYSNQTIIVPYSNASKSSPCGVGEVSAVINTANEICYEFIQAFPESTNYWASIYDLNNNLINGGYIGNANYDLFDRRNASFPPYITGSWKRNGYQLFNTDSLVSYQAQVFGWYNSVLVSNGVPLVCGEANAGTYITNSNQNVYYLAHYGIPELVASQGVELHSICDIKGAFIQQNRSLLSFYNTDYYISLENMFGGYAYPSLLNGELYIYSQNIVNEYPGNGGTIYKAKYNPLMLYLPSAKISSNLFGTHLINLSRPVSPLGAFRT